MAILYPVLKNIRYKGPGKLHRALITPDMDEAKKGLPFDHLTAAEIELLQRKGILGKPAASVPAEDSKSGGSKK